MLEKILGILNIILEQDSFYLHRNCSVTNSPQSYFKRQRRQKLMLLSL